MDIPELELAAAWAVAGKYKRQLCASLWLLTVKFKDDILGTEDKQIMCI